MRKQTPAASDAHLWDFVTVAEHPKTGALSPHKHLLVTWRLPTPEEGASLSRRMGRRHRRLRPTTFLQSPLLPPCLSPFTTLSSHWGPKPRWFSALAVSGAPAETAMTLHHCLIRDAPWWLPRVPGCDPAQRLAPSSLFPSAASTWPLSLLCKAPASVSIRSLR